ncbi:olfactory receptor 13G1-like [Pleurodeles waltl]|uniref:olfactory receptor 13G1-like n=1 Tax=Pleurodeles waltl TaxID=8319 RepID=UPI003709842E
MTLTNHNFSMFLPISAITLLSIYQMMPLILTEHTNKTSCSEFFFMGFSSQPQMQPTFFAVLLLMYLLALLGNVLIILIISTDDRLHTPMYFFLINLAVLDISLTSCIIPKFLVILLSETKSISYFGCMTQLYLLTWSLGTELMLLTVMAFDRYVAICIPLHYLIIMCKKIYASLAAIIWFVGLCNATIHTSYILKLSFSEINYLDHFFCEIPAVLKVSLSDTYLVKIAVLVTDIFLGMICFLFILVSYIQILTSIVKMRSTEKKMKAFSTCASHIMVVTLYCGSTIYAYILPALGYGSKGDKVASALYALVSPVVNPMLYSLRNADEKQAFFKIFARHILPRTK